MKRVLFLGLILSFLVGSSGVFALTIDAQSSTVCKEGFCYTVVDLSKYLTAGSLTAVKGINFTNFLPKIASVKGMSYSLNGNVFNISGQVRNMVYWTMDLNGYALIDPYWTYGGENVLASADSVGDPSSDGSNYFGIKFKTNASYSVDLVGVHYQSNPYTVTRVYAQDGQTVICTNNTAGMGSSGWANFTGCVLNASTNYSVVGVPSGTRIYKDPGTYPQSNKDITLLAGQSSGLPLGAGNTLIFEYDKLVTRIATWTNETASSTTVYINGNSTHNQTNYNNTDINLTGTTNATGMWIALYVNNTLSGNGTTTITNVTKFTAGLWNITALSGSNATLNSSHATLWLNISNIVLGQNYTWYIYQYCLNDNRTLFTNTTYTLPMLQNYYNYTNCNYGCDNTTATCRNNPAYEGLLLLVIVGFMLYGAYYLVRHL